MYKMIVTHRSIHLDEIVAIALLQWYGKQKYPGIETALVRYVEDEPTGTDEQFDADGILPIGLGRGRFDDKDKTGDRIPCVCSATRVADNLGLSNDSRFKPFLDEVLACDSKNGVRITQLAGIIKAINRCFGGDQMQVVKFVRTAVEVIIKQLAYKFSPVSGELGAVDFFQRFAQKRKLDDERALKYIASKLENASYKEDESVTELGYILRVMQRQNIPNDEIAEWAEFSFQRLYEDQIAFNRTRELIRPDRKTHRGKVSEEFSVRCGGHGHEQEIDAIIVKSDEPNAHSVALCLGYDVVVCRRSSGQTQIFTSDKAHVSLRHTVAMLRWLDLPLSKKDSVSWEDLMVSGEHPLVPKWHFFEQAGQVFNGTQTHRGVSASEICLEALKETISCAFHARLIARWRNKRYIKKPSVGEEIERLDSVVIDKMAEVFDRTLPKVQPKATPVPLASLAGDEKLVALALAAGGRRAGTTTPHPALTKK